MQTRKHYFSVKLQLPTFVIKMWDKEKRSSTMHCALLLSKVSSQILVIYRTGTIFREISLQLLRVCIKKNPLQFFREINFTKIYYS